MDNSNLPIGTIIKKGNYTYKIVDKLGGYIYLKFDGKTDERLVRDEQICYTHRFGDYPDCIYIFPNKLSILLYKDE